MNDSRKISYQSLKEKLSDEKLKLIIAGSGHGTGGDYCCRGTVLADYYPDGRHWLCDTGANANYCTQVYSDFEFDGDFETKSGSDCEGFCSPDN